MTVPPSTERLRSQVASSSDHHVDLGHNFISFTWQECILITLPGHIRLVPDVRSVDVVQMYGRRWLDSCQNRKFISVTIRNLIFSSTGMNVSQ